MQVSIIIPVYNAVDDLNDAVQCALEQQGLQDFEIIIVDNVSTDGSTSLAEKLATEHHSVTLLLEKNQGSAYARNKGLDHAQGQWIQYLDVDDRIDPFKISRQIAVSKSVTGIVISPYIEISVSGSSIKTDLNTSDPWLGIITGQLGVTSSILWNKNSLLKVGKWNTNQKSHQEYELIFRLLQAQYNISFDNEYTTTKYEKAGAISSSIHFPLEGIRLRQKIEGYLNHHSLLKSEQKKALQDYYYNKLLWAYKLDLRSAMQYENHIKIDFNTVDRPWYHQLFTPFIGRKNLFRLISKLHKGH